MHLSGPQGDQNPDPEWRGAAGPADMSMPPDETPHSVPVTSSTLSIHTYTLGADTWADTHIYTHTKQIHIGWSESSVNTR